MAAEKLKRSNIVNALARNFNLSRDLLNRTLSSGAYTCQRAVFSAEGPHASWIFVVTQDDCFKPTTVLAYRKENNVVCKHEVCATDEDGDDGFNVGPTAVIRYVTQWVASRMAQTEIFNDTQAWYEMRNLYRELTNPNKDTVYSATTVSRIEESENGLIAKMIYKSDLTTIAGRAYRIMIMRVQDDSGRDDLYKVAFYAKQDTQTRVLSPVFGRVAACYNNGDHAGMLLALHDQNYSDGLYKLEKEAYPTEHSCVNITTPKCVDPTDPKTPIRDTSFTFLRTYAVVDTESAIDSNKYITLINDDGDEVSRRATHFVELPRKDKK